MIEKKLSAIAIALCAFPCIAAAQDASEATTDTTTDATTDVKKIESIKIVGQKLDEARNGLSPDTGSTIFRIGRTDIQLLPLGDSTPLNQVILQAPGVVQDLSLIHI